MTVAPTHPLAADVSALDAMNEWLGVSSGIPAGLGEAGSDWYRCADVREDAAFFATWRDGIRDHLTGLHDGVVPPGLVPFMWTMEWYVGVPAALAGMTFALGRRVPDLGPADLAFHLAPGSRHVDAVAILGDGFACLPGDPAAGHPAATVVADEQALAARMRDQVIDHVTPVFAHTAPGVRIGPRQLWGLVTDGMDQAIWNLGIARRDIASAASAATVALGEVEQPPMVGTSTLGTLVDGRGRTQWYRERQTCCFHYRLPGQRRNPCFTCPRTTADERVQRAAQWSEFGPI